MDKSDLSVPETGLPALTSDLNEMQSYLTLQAKRMAEIFGVIKSGWSGPAAQTYSEFQQGVAEDLVRIRSSLQLLEEAVRMSNDGFSAQELDTLRGFQRIQSSTNFAADARELTDTTAETTATSPPSKILDL